MKKQLFIFFTLIAAVSYDAFAGTGGPQDGLQFFLVIIGIMLFILGLISGGDYLRKNGKTLIIKAITKAKRMVISLKEYLLKLKSEYLDLSYF